MRRLRPLTGADVEQLPDPCRRCVAWEYGAACPSPRTASAAVPGRSGDGPAHEERQRDEVRKQAWVSAQVQDGQPPGRILHDRDGELVGYALYAPASAFAPRRAPVPSVDDDTVLLATLWVQPDRRGHGVGRLLLQAAIKDALHAGAPAVEAYGDRRWVERGCVLPITWLLHEGFEVHREHPRNPLLRLDVRRTARWAESFEHALEELLGALPRRAPQPAREPRLAPGGVPDTHASERPRPGPPPA